MKRKPYTTYVTLLLAVVLFIGSSVQPYRVYADDDTEEALLDTEGNTVPEENYTPNTGNVITPPQAELSEAEENKQNLQQQLDKINTELQELEQQQDKIKQNLNNVRGEREEKQAIVNNIGGQISNTQYEIELMQSKIYLLELDISEKEDNIAKKEKEYEENYAVFCERLRVTSMHSNSSTIGLILGTDSYLDFLTTSDTMSRIADHDQKIMDDLIREKALLEEEKESLLGSQQDLSATRAATQVKVQELAVQQEVAIGEVQSVANLQAQFEAELAASQQKSAQMQSQIEAIYAQIKLSENPYVGGAMMWPAPSANQITSYYGWRFGGTDFHTGIDLSGGGVLGTPVVAANDGTIVTTNWSHSPGVGYGIFIIVDHGGGTTTVYAHLSNINVSVGQQVKRGQQIGAVGSTGWSTGPHLHFEVRENNAHVNPQPYITA